MRAVGNKLNCERPYPMCKWSPAAATDRPALCFHLLIDVCSNLLESFRLFFFCSRRSTLALSPWLCFPTTTRRSFSSLSLATFFRSVCVALDRELRSLPHSPTSNQRMSARPGEIKVRGDRDSLVLEFRLLGCVECRSNDSLMLFF